MAAEKRAAKAATTWFWMFTFDILISFRFNLVFRSSC
jgi:hypothetical protein